MGPWADGCEVTAVSGTVLIIEWHRGTDVWRQTLLEPGETHVIDLVGSEDNAMIESQDNAPTFRVILDHCNPQPRQASRDRTDSGDGISRRVPQFRTGNAPS